MNPEFLLISGDCCVCDLDPVICLSQGYCIYEDIDISESDVCENNENQNTN